MFVMLSRGLGVDQHDIEHGEYDVKKGIPGISRTGHLKDGKEGSRHNQDHGNNSESHKRSIRLIRPLTASTENQKHSTLCIPFPTKGDSQRSQTVYVSSYPGHGANRECAHALEFGWDSTEREPFGRQCIQVTQMFDNKYFRAQ